MDAPFAGAMDEHGYQQQRARQDRIGCHPHGARGSYTSIAAAVAAVSGMFPNARARMAPASRDHRAAVVAMRSHAAGDQ